MQINKRVRIAVAIGVMLLIIGFVSQAYSDSEDRSNESFIGTWLRQGTYINGALEHTTPATMVLGKDSFYSTGTCSASGSLTHQSTSITMKMTQSDCPGGLALPFTVTFTFKISGEGKKMTLQAGNVMEKYLRKEGDENRSQEKKTEPKPSSEPQSEPQPEPDAGNANEPPGTLLKPSHNKVLVE